MMLGRLEGWEIRDSESNDVYSVIEQVSLSFSQDRGPLPWKVQMPGEFCRAWVHLLAFLNLGTLVKRDFDSKVYRLMQRELESFGTLMFKGRNELLRSMSSIPLVEREAVLPQGIMTLIIKKLSEDVTFDQPNISATYFSYYLKLVSFCQIEFGIIHECDRHRKITFERNHTAAVTRNTLLIFAKKLLAL